MKIEVIKEENNYWEIKVGNDIIKIDNKASELG